MASVAERNLMRLLIGDVITQNMVETDLIFSDDELNSFYVYEGSRYSIRACVPMVLRWWRIAISHLNEGQRTDLSFSVNGISVAGELRRRAIELRAIRDDATSSNGKLAVTDIRKDVLC